MMMEQNTNYAYMMKCTENPTCSRFVTFAKNSLCNFT